MKNSQAVHPIGIFDSGVGGLTVMHALTKMLPHENMIYFGDTAHHPYGEKSAEAIQQYVLKICEWLIEKQCKLLLIACYSASAAAYQLLREKVGDDVLVVNMIDPVVEYLKENFAHSKIGLIGTKQTVSSAVFQKKLAQHQIACFAKATPLLAPMIEEGFAGAPMIAEVLQHYLGHNELQNIETLVLACTHYPIIRQQVLNYYAEKINVLDPAEIVAKTTKQLLAENHLLNIQTQVPHRAFYISDSSEAFLLTAKEFFADPVYLHHYPMWETSAFQ